MNPCRPYFLTVSVLFGTVVLAQTPGSATRQNRPAPSNNQNMVVSNGTSGTIPEVGASTATSEENFISGCLFQRSGRFEVNDGPTKRVYEVRGSNLANYSNHVVYLQGVPDLKERGGKSILIAQNIRDTGETCNPSESSIENLPVVGKTGNKGTAQNVTSTANPQETTPGVHSRRSVNRGAATENTKFTDKWAPGQPPNFEEAGQGSASAVSMAGGAEQTEVGAPEGTYGVGNSLPDYSKKENVSGAMSQQGITNGKPGSKPQPQNPK